MLVKRYITILVLFSSAHSFAMRMGYYEQAEEIQAKLDGKFIPQPSIVSPVPTNSWFKAAFAGNFNLCLDFINKGRKIDERDADGWNALLWAAKGGHRNLCRVFLKQAVLRNRAVKVLLLSLKRLIKEGDSQAFVLYTNRDKLIIPYVINDMISIQNLLRAAVEVESLETPLCPKEFRSIKGQSVEGIDPKIVKKFRNAYDFLSMDILDFDQWKTTIASVHRVIKDKDTPLQNAGESCTSCLKAGAKQRCGGCKKVCYCDAQCQRSHWQEHKGTCKSLSC